jgi:Lrp/AsnC family leucine-responsive transcriptional regulator
MKELLDDIDNKLMVALRDDARASFRTLARVIGLSTPATAERVRRLERLGVVRGYHVRIDRAAAGRGVTAFLTIDCPGNRSQAALGAARQSDDVLDYYRIAGASSVMLKVAVADLAALDRLAERFRLIAPTSVTVVLSTAFEEGDRGP